MTSLPKLKLQFKIHTIFVDVTIYFIYEEYFIIYIQHQSQS